MGSIVRADSSICCGEVTWYLNHAMVGNKDVYDKEHFKAELHKQATAETNKGVAHCILTAAQIAPKGSDLWSPEKILLEFGFKKSWGPIINPNTRTKLFGYDLDLNAWREKNLSKPEGLVKKVI